MGSKPESAQIDEQGAKRATGSGRRAGRRLVRGLLLAGIGLLSAAILGAATGRGRSSPHLIWHLILLLILGVNALWWLTADRRLTAGIRGRSTRFVSRALLVVWMALAAGPVALLSGDASLRLERWPLPWVVAVQMWNMGLVVYMAAAGAVKVALRLGGWLTWRVRTPPPAIDASRRAFLGQAAVCAPLVLTGGVVPLSVRQRGEFEINHLTLRLPRWPSRLRGLTVTHLSDLHVGRFMRPASLPRIVEAVNRLGSDLVLMTGDLIDLSIDLLPDGVEALKQIEARYGLYMVEGNHDLIDEPREFVAYCRDSGLNLLINERRTLRIDGERITLAGLGWSRQELAGGERPADARNADGALRGSPPERFRLVMVHHPHAFDVLGPRGVDLTLAGHTHGGQLMLSPPGLGNLGVGRLMFRYLRGLYRRGGAQMVVSAGVGDWFPLRINAPAEIVQLRLT